VDLCAQVTSFFYEMHYLALAIKAAEMLCLGTWGDRFSNIATVFPYYSNWQNCLQNAH